ncbi:MAG TPA: DUF2089 domain-containing protein [Bacilli bacterium]|nr:DUF2089 domain-containing protein [Bacilli bacterium]
MKKQVIPVCPICKENLMITGVHCHSCGITINGEFTLSKFDYLSSEQLKFVEIFIKNQGNIKAIEKEMNISYPTVKRLLSEAIIALGYETVDEFEPSPVYQPYKPNKPDKPSKNEILKRVADKEISVEEAIVLLKGERK